MTREEKKREVAAHNAEFEIDRADKKQKLGPFRDCLINGCRDDGAGWIRHFCGNEEHR